MAVGYTKSVRLRLLGDDSGAMDAMDRVETKADEVGRKSATVRLLANDDNADRAFKHVQTELDLLGRRTATVKVSADAKKAEAKLSEVQLKLDKLNDTTAAPEVRLRGYERARIELLKLDAALDKLSAKSATADVKVNQKHGISKVFGGLFGGGNLAKEGEQAGEEFSSGFSSVLESPAGLAAIGGAGGVIASLVPSLAAIGVSAGAAFSGAFLAVMRHKNLQSAFAGLLKPLENTANVLVKPLEGIAGEFKKALGGTIGKDLRQMFSASIPVLKQFAGLMLQVSKILLPAFTQVIKQLVASGSLKIFAQGIIALTKGFVTFLKILGPSGIQNSMVVFKGLCVALAIALGAAAVICKAAAATVRGFGMVVTGMVKIVAAVFTGNWKAAWNACKSIATGAMMAISGGWLHTLHGIAHAFDTSRHQIARIWDALMGVLERASKAAWNAAKKAFSSGARAVENTVRGLWHNVAHTFDTLRHSMASSFSKAWSAVKHAASSGIKDVEHIVYDAGHWFYEAGSRIAHLIANGLRAAAHFVTSSIHKVTGWIRDALPFSPAKSGPLSGSGSPELAGRKIATMLADGMSANGRVVITAVAKLATQVVQQMTKLRTDTVNVWSDTWKTVENHLSDATDKIKSLMQSMRNTIGNAFSQIKKDNADGTWLAMWHSIENVFNDSTNWLDSHMSSFTHTYANYFSSLRSAVVDCYRAMMTDIEDASTNMVNRVGKAVTPIEGKFKTPFNYVVDHIIRPFGNIWNTLDSKLKLKIPSFPAVHGFSGGGRVPGSGIGDTVPALLTPNERVLSTNQVNALGGHSMLDAAVGRGTGGPMHYAGGGIAGTGPDTPAGIESLITKAAKQAGVKLDAATIAQLAVATSALPGSHLANAKQLYQMKGTAGGENKLLKGAIPSALGGSGEALMAAAMALEAVAPVVTEAFSGVPGKSGGSAGGGSGSAVAKLAATFATGRNHPYAFNQAHWGGPWDCVGFAEDIYDRMGLLHDPYKVGTHVGACASLYADRTQLEVGTKQPGAMVFCAGADGTHANPGHVGIVYNADKYVGAADEAEGTVFESISRANPSGYRIPKKGFTGGGVLGPFHDADSGGTGPGLLNVAKFLIGAGYSKAAAAGMAGVVGGEAGPDGSPESVGSGGAGLIGWTPPHAMIAYGGTCHACGIGHNSTIIDMHNQEHAMVKWAKAFGFPPPQGRFPDTVAGAMKAAYAASAAYERPAVPGSDVHSSIISSVFHGLANGGVINEPIFGRGLLTGRGYNFGEKGAEAVVPLDRAQSYMNGAAEVYNITVNGALDPRAVSLQIQQILRKRKRQNGGYGMGLD